MSADWSTWQSTKYATTLRPNLIRISEGKVRYVCFEITDLEQVLDLKLAWVDVAFFTKSNMM